jgi:outer membrane protein TolC
MIAVLAGVMLICILPALNFAAGSSARELDVAEVLRAAEAISPDLKAAMQQEAQARQAIGIIQSEYYPTLDLEGTQSYGFPGSNGALGVRGLAGSPFRDGPGGDAVTQLSLFDLGRHARFKTAQAQLIAAQERTKIIRFEVYLAALQIYFDGVRFRGQQEAWKDIGSDVARVAGVVDKLVKNGQHSVAEHLLVADQTHEAAMLEAAYAERYGIALRRLELFTGIPETGVACPPPQAVSEAGLSAIQPGEASPLIVTAEAQAALAHTAISERTAENYPVLLGLASVGDVNQAHLLSKQDYSGGFAVTMPLFKGFRIQDEIHQAQALAAERDQGLVSSKLSVAELNARYDETIAASRAEIEYLKVARGDAEEALKQTWRRYLTYVGPLVEVREAIRNLGRIKSQAIDIKTDLLLALSSKAVLNGGYVK